MNKQKVLFIDLDGTIIETKSGNTFPVNIDDWKFKSGILTKLARYYDKGYSICIVSNQQGVEEGYVKPLEIQEKIQLIIRNIKEFISNEYSNKIKVLNISYKFSFSEYSNYRKPNIETFKEYNIMLRQNYNSEIDIENSLMVGDASGLKRKSFGSNGIIVKEDFSDSDKKFAENCGIKYIDIEEFLK